MAERDATLNSGEEFTNAPTRDIGLDPAAHFRTLSQRLDGIAAEMHRIQDPKPFRLADIGKLATVLIALLVAIFTALGLNNRIDDLVKAQIAAETRLSAQSSAAETRLSTRIERLDDRIARMGKGTATLESARPDKTRSDPTIVR